MKKDNILNIFNHFLEEQQIEFYKTDTLICAVIVVKYNYSKNTLYEILINDNFKLRKHIDLILEFGFVDKYMESYNQDINEKYTEIQTLIFENSIFEEINDENEFKKILKDYLLENDVEIIDKHCHLISFKRETKINKYKNITKPIIFTPEKAK